MGVLGGVHEGLEVEDVEARRVEVLGLRFKEWSRDGVVVISFVFSGRCLGVVI